MSMKAKQQTKTERLGETIVKAFYLALELRELSHDVGFVERRTTDFTADLVYNWAKRQSERRAAARPCFKEMSSAAPASADAQEHRIVRLVFKQSSDR